MDLSKITPVELLVDVRHPATKEPTGLKLRILSDDDPRVSEAKRKVFDGMREKGRKLTKEEDDAFSFDLQTAHLAGWEWEGDATFNGKKPPFNAENVREVLKAVPIVRNTIQESIRDDAAFYKA